MFPPDASQLGLDTGSVRRHDNLGICELLRLDRLDQSHNRGRLHVLVQALLVVIPDEGLSESSMISM